jgi:hypothetical protein
MLQQARERHWTWASLERNMNEFAGAMSRLDHYAETSKGIKLNDSHVWKDAVRMVRQQTHVEEPRTPLAMRQTHVNDLLREHQNANPTMAKLLLLSWTVVGRVQDVLQLRAEHLVRDENDPTSITFTFKAGKGVKARGPYPVTTIVSPEFLHLLPSPQQKGPIFNCSSTAEMQRLRNELLQFIRLKDPLYECRSLRRGRLQQLARTGAPTSVISNFAGHTNERTTDRYLQWGLMNRGKCSNMKDVSRAVAKKAGATSAPSPASSQ